MAKALDYAKKAHDFELTYAGKGTDYLVLAAEQFSSFIDMAPKMPDFLDRAVKPFVEFFGTPAENMQYAQAVMADWVKLLDGFQGRFSEVVEASRVERLADRAKEAEYYDFDDVKDAVGKVRSDAAGAASKVTTDARGAVYKLREETKDAVDKVSLETKDVADRMRRDAAKIRHDAMDAVDKMTADAKDAATKVRYDAAKMRHDAMEAVDKVTHDAKDLPARLRRGAAKVEEAV